MWLAYASQRGKTCTASSTLDHYHGMNVLLDGGDYMILLGELTPQAVTAKRYTQIVRLSTSRQGERYVDNRTGTRKFKSNHKFSECFLWGEISLKSIDIHADPRLSDPEAPR